MGGNGYRPSMMTVALRLGGLTGRSQNRGSLCSDGLGFGVALIRSDPCPTCLGAGLSISKGKLTLNSARRLWRAYGAGRGVGASPDLYCMEGIAADPLPGPRGGCSHAAQVVPPRAQGPLLNRTIKSLSPGFSVSMCRQVS